MDLTATKVVFFTEIIVMNNSLLPELGQIIHKECCKGKNTEAIVGINGVKSVFLYGQLQFERFSGAGKGI